MEPISANVECANKLVDELANNALLKSRGFDTDDLLLTVEYFDVRDMLIRAYDAGCRARAA